MLPIGPLMIEHRLIERMIAIMDSRAREAEQAHSIDPLFVDAVVDFIREYADRTHHGKEEDILFRDLAKRALSGEHARIMGELIDEHKVGRRMVGELTAANESYRHGASESLGLIVDTLLALVDFYPKHIEKEDQVFFPASMTYLGRSEKDAMLEEMSEFDRRMIHEKYVRVVEGLQGQA